MQFQAKRMLECPYEGLALLPKILGLGSRLTHSLHASLKVAQEGPLFAGCFGRWVWPQGVTQLGSLGAASIVREGVVLKVTQICRAETTTEP